MEGAELLTYYTFMMGVVQRSARRRNKEHYRCNYGYIWLHAFKVTQKFYITTLLNCLTYPEKPHFLARSPSKALDLEG